MAKSRKKIFCRDLKRFQMKTDTRKLRRGKPKTVSVLGNVDHINANIWPQNDKQVIPV